MIDEPIFIRAINLRAAQEAARALGLNPSPNTRSWHFLDDPYRLRGRPNLRIALGHRAYDHPAASDILRELTLIDRARPGTIELIEVP